MDGEAGVLSNVKFGADQESGGGQNRGGCRCMSQTSQCHCLSPCVSAFREASISLLVAGREKASPLRGRTPGAHWNERAAVCFPHVPFRFTTHFPSSGQDLAIAYTPGLEVVITRDTDGAPLAGDQAFSRAGELGLLRLRTAFRAKDEGGRLD